MLFNSLDFAVFLPLVFIVYWFVLDKKLQAQNLFIALASYVFYGWWDWRFLSLIIFSTLVDYFIGLQIFRTSKESTRKALVGLSLTVNLGLLGFFKYYNFFVDTFIEGFSLLGYDFSARSLNLILPVGISFYTFQTLSYTLDIYRQKLTPTRNFIAFASFVSFFPQLVAGPIERAKHLLPQFYTARKFNYAWAVSGVKLIIWGLFKKMVIADNAALLVDGIYSNYQYESSWSLLVGMVLFSFQIYGDFSGYSDIAIGLSRLLGFDLMTNFRFPYFSRNIREFWSRWHISLSTWFRDYLYIPLGGNRGTRGMVVRNIFIVFLVSGLWHGANWTFVFWGFIHALLFIPLLFIALPPVTQVSVFNLTSFTQRVMTFSLVTFAWVFFRAENISQALKYLSRLLQGQTGHLFIRQTTSYTLMFASATLGILILLLLEYRCYRQERSNLQLPSWHYLWMALLISFLGVFKNQSDFIYFQF